MFRGHSLLFLPVKARFIIFSHRMWASHHDSWESCCICNQETVHRKSHGASIREYNSLCLSIAFLRFCLAHRFCSAVARKRSHWNTCPRSHFELACSSGTWGHISHPVVTTHKMLSLSITNTTDHECCRHLHHHKPYRVHTEGIFLYFKGQLHSKFRPLENTISV